MAAHALVRQHLIDKITEQITFLEHDWCQKLGLLKTA